MLIPLFPSDVGLINLDRAVVGPRSDVPHVADTVRHVPSGLLGDAQIPVQFHGRYALEVGAVEIEGNSPFRERDVGILQDRTSLDREILAAGVAVEGHGFPRLLPANAVALASRTPDTVWPSSCDEPFLSLEFSAEHLDGIHESDAVAVRFAGSIACHNYGIILRIPMLRHAYRVAFDIIPILFPPCTDFRQSRGCDGLDRFIRKRTMASPSERTFVRMFRTG